MTPLPPKTKPTENNSSGATAQSSPNAKANFQQHSPIKSQASSSARSSSRRLSLASLPPTSHGSSPEPSSPPSTSTSTSSPSTNVLRISPTPHPIPPIRPSLIPSPSIRPPPLPPLHPTLHGQSIFPSTNTYTSSLPPLSNLPLRSASAPASSPNHFPLPTRNDGHLPGRQECVRHTLPNGLLYRFLRKAKGWLPWNIKRLSSQNERDFVRLIGIVASTPDGGEYLIHANSLIDSTTSGPGLIREGILPLHMKDSMVDCSSAEGNNRVVRGRNVAIRGKVEVMWIGVNRKRGLVNLPRKRRRTWLYVAADPLEYDLIFGADTINMERLFSEQVISAAVASNRIAPPPRPIQGPRRAEHYAVWLADRQAHAAQLTQANAKNTITRASTMPCTTTSSTLLTGLTNDSHPTTNQPHPPQRVLTTHEATQEPLAALSNPTLSTDASAPNIPEHPQFYLGYDGRCYARASHPPLPDHS